MDEGKDDAPLTLLFMFLAIIDRGICCETLSEMPFIVVYVCNLQHSDQSGEPTCGWMNERRRTLWLESKMFWRES